LLKSLDGKAGDGAAGGVNLGVFIRPAWATVLRKRSWVAEKWIVARTSPAVAVVV